MGFLRNRSLGRDFSFESEFFYAFNSTSSWTMFIIGLTMSAYFRCFADKEHVSPKISCVNVPGLNFLLRLEIFVSEDRQLWAVHLILGYEPLSRIYQDTG